MELGIADGENKTTGLSLRGAGLEKNQEKQEFQFVFCNENL